MTFNYDGWTITISYYNIVRFSYIASKGNKCITGLVVAFSEEDAFELVKEKLQ